jgi:NAD(P)-dependent dehydrogenase (short-subunit alcohol dehydrogenase family)
MEGIMQYLVTGANRGIGLELVKQLAARGKRVFATARQLEKAHALQELGEQYNGQIVIISLDVTDPSSIADCYAQVEAYTSEVDVLINNAGVGDSSEKLGEITQETLLRIYMVNTAGPLLVAQQFLPMLTKGEGKKIVNISSGAGSIAMRKDGRMYAYCASKAALNMLTKILSLSLKSFGIVVISQCPGWVKTDMGGPDAILSPEESIKGILSVLDGLKLDDTGKFFSHQGEEYPW